MDIQPSIVSRIPDGVRVVFPGVPYAKTGIDLNAVARGFDLLDNAFGSEANFKLPILPKAHSIRIKHSFFAGITLYNSLATAPAYIQILTDPQVYFVGSGIGGQPFKADGLPIEFTQIFNVPETTFQWIEAKTLHTLTAPLKMFFQHAFNARDFEPTATFSPDTAAVHNWLGFYLPQVDIFLKRPCHVGY